MSQDPSSLHGPGEPERVRWTLDIVQARVGLPELRVLDLACRTGAFSTAFADAGATVHGIEARQDNLEHVPSSSATYELGDVRELSSDSRYDVVLCLGILYHLEAGDALRLLSTMRRISYHFAVIDTHVGADTDEVVVDGRTYRGSVYGEVLGHPWSALDNPTSWWFGEESLNWACYAAGWDKVERIPGRSWAGEDPDRRWLVVS